MIGRPPSRRHVHDVPEDACACAGPQDAAPQLALPHDEVHVWCCPCGGPLAPTLERRWRTLMSPPERERHARIRWADDQRRHLAARALLRCALSRYAAVPPEAWRFRASPSGRPGLQAPDAATLEGLDFNLAHADGLVVLGLARGRTVGIDAEAHGRAVSRELVERSCAPAEFAAWNALPDEARQDRFLGLWTLKESLAKACGRGLALPFERVEFEVDDATRHIALAPGARAWLAGAGLGGAADGWQFWQWHPRDRHALAVCASRPAGAPARIVCREMLPLAWERPLAAEGLRGSG